VGGMSLTNEIGLWFVFDPVSGSFRLRKGDVLDCFLVLVRRAQKVFIRLGRVSPANGGTKFTCLVH